MSKELHCSLCGPGVECPGHRSLMQRLLDAAHDLDGPAYQPLDSRAHAGDGDSAAREAGALFSRWVFTFGCGSPLARYYVRIEAKSEMQARARMVGMFSSHWASIYTEQEFALGQQAERFRLIELHYNRTAGVRIQTNNDELARDLYELAYPWR